MSRLLKRPTANGTIRDFKIDRILQNTDEVKAVIIKDDKQKKESARKAHSKFKKIGSNLKLEQAEQIERLCEEKGISVSQYVKNLIDADLNPKPRAKPKAKQNFWDWMKSLFN